MDTICSWSSRFASSHVWVRYHIWTHVRRPIVLVLNWMKLYFIGLENVVEAVNERNECA